MSPPVNSGSNAERGDGAVRSSLPIYQELRERISLLIYPPGAVLSENRLAEEFGVSRTPIRYVLHQLEFDGLVESKHGVGTIVPSLDFKYLKEVYALRLKLIDLIGELTSCNVSEGDLLLLETLLAQVQALTESRAPLELGRLYLRFNEELSRMIGNKPLRDVADRLFYQTSRVWLQILPELDWEGEVDYVCDEISGVLSALRDEDMQALAETRRRHFVMCLQRINAYLGGTWMGEV